MKINKKLIIPGILLFVLAIVLGNYMIKPNPQILAQEILDKLKTTESDQVNVRRWFYMRMNGNFELNGVNYSKDKGDASVLEISSSMILTNDPYHLETKGSVTQKALNISAQTLDETKTDYQLTSDETDGMSHLSMNGETRDFKYSYCPSLNLALFEGIADGTIKVTYGHSDDDWKDDFDYLYLDVVVSGDALKNFFLDEEKELFGYDLDNAEWDSMQVPCRITVDKDNYKSIKIETDINHMNNSITSEQIQPLIDQSFPGSDYEVSVFHVIWDCYLGD